VNPGLGLKPPQSLPIDYTSALTSFAAVVDVNLFDIVHISASFALTDTTVDVDTDGNGTRDLDDAPISTYAISVDPDADPVQTVTIAVGGVGVVISSGNVVIAVIAVVGGPYLHRSARRQRSGRDHRPAGRLLARAHADQLRVQLRAFRRRDAPPDRGV
jgi:hypothetical protein